MMLIQIIVTLVALGIVFFVFLGQGHASSAWKKIALLILSISMIIAVLFPGETTNIAHLVGVGRGADLLLYLLSLAFIGYVINNYVHQKRDKDIVFRLARKVALLDANERHRVRKK